MWGYGFGEREEKVRGIARPRRREDRKFQRQGSDAVAFPEIDKKAGNVRIGHRDIVAVIADLFRARQQVVEMSAPCGRVFA